MKVVVVESTWGFRNEYEAALKSIGCQISCVHRIIGNEKILSRFKPDMIIWNKDLRLYIDDFRAIKKIANLENIHLAAIGSELDQSTIGMAFDEGADDYFVTPLDKNIMIKKIQALTKKVRPQQLDKCGFKLDVKLLKADYKNQELVLTKTQFNILFELLKHYPETAHRQDLNKNVLKDVIVTERTIDVHVCGLRKKLKQFKIGIESNRSLGYRLRLEFVENDLQKNRPA